MKETLNISILFIIFNRPDLTRKVFNEIRKAKPKKLFISSDGHRDNIPGEAEKCLAARNIINNIDWQCEVKTLFHKTNLGCREAPYSAIKWFFDNVEMGIILEDDCLPNQSFFWFCQELLATYRYDTRIMMISGNNFFIGNREDKGSYFFSKFPLTWGWATWKRAWQYYDINLHTFPEFEKQKLIRNIFNEEATQNYWLERFHYVYTGQFTTCWDYQWSYTIFCQNGLCIIPDVNLVVNIGFREDGTHTKTEYPFLTKIKQKEMHEIIHPKFILPDKGAEEFIFKNFYRIRKKKSLLLRLKDKLISLIKPIEKSGQ